MTRNGDSRCAVPGGATHKSAGCAGASTLADFDGPVTPSDLTVANTAYRPGVGYPDISPTFATIIAVVNLAFVAGYPAWGIIVGLRMVVTCTRAGHVRPSA
jgi:hypothetical protein